MLIEDLYQKIEEAQEAGVKIRDCTKAEADSVLRRVKEKFAENPEETTFWNHLKGEVSSHSYERDGFRVIKTLVPVGDPQYLFLTAGTEPPWRCFSGDIDAVLSLLNRLPKVEFFLVDQDYQAVVIHNQDMKLILSKLT